MYGVIVTWRAKDRTFTDAVSDSNTHTHTHTRAQIHPPTHTHLIIKRQETTTVEYYDDGVYGNHFRTCIWMDYTHIHNKAQHSPTCFAFSPTDWKFFGRNRSPVISVMTGVAFASDTLPEFFIYVKPSRWAHWSHHIPQVKELTSCHENGVIYHHHNSSKTKEQNITPFCIIVRRIVYRKWKPFTIIDVQF